MAVKLSATATSADADAQHPQKRQRTSLASSLNSQVQTSKKQVLRAIQSLEADLSSALASSSPLNPLVDLLSLASSNDDPEVVSKAIYALYRIYAQIVSKGLLEKSKPDDGLSEKEAEERNAVRSWLLSNINDFGDILGGLLKDEEGHLRTSALQILFTILKLLSTPARASKSPADDELKSQAPSSWFYGPFFNKIVLALLSCPPTPRQRHETDESEIHNRLIDSDICENFTRTWLNKYADVRWYFLREVITIISTSSLLTSHPMIPANALSILERWEDLPTRDSDIDSFWLEGFGSQLPRMTKTKTNSTTPDSESEADAEEDDWRTFFDDPQPSTTTISQSQTKKKRIHRMSVAEQIRSVASHRAVFTRCWITLLPLLSSPAFVATGDEKGKSGKNDSKRRKSEKQATKTIAVPDATSLTTRALTVLHRGVMPHLTRAVLVMDWVAGCVDQGGVVGMLALNALFILMKDYNLDYPQFYTRLYAFLDREVLHAKYRARFFRLLELFLSSTHLPVTLLASFIKRLARLSVSAPPAAIVLIIPFTYNILKRHPALMVMIHNSNPAEEIDPFLPDATNPQQTHALESSLWELYTHTRHYHHSVSVLARVFEGAFTKPQYGMEDFLDHSYASLFDTESSRKIKLNTTVPVIEPEVAKLRKLATKRRENDDAVDGVDDAAGTEGIDIVSSLWRF